MRIVLFALSTLIVTACFSQESRAQDQKLFKPASAWALDYGEDYCRLMRDFTHDGETIGLFIERTRPGALMRLIVVGNSVRLFRGAQQIGYRMAPSGSIRQVPRLRSETSDGQQYLNLGPTTFADPAATAPGGPFPPAPAYDLSAEAQQAAGITGIRLDAGLVSPLLIETGRMDGAARALQTCADDLLASWGLDAESHRALSRPAMPAEPTAGWIAANTIPFGDFAKMGGGNNDLRIMIDRQGRPKSCHVQWPVLPASVNAKVCAAVMEKAKFSPALGPDGQPVDSYWIASPFMLLPPFGQG